MKKSLILFCLTIFFVSNLFAQRNTIRGSVVDVSQQRDVKNTVIALINPKDSILYAFTRVDANGDFTLKNIQSGKYLITTTHPYFADVVDTIEMGSTDKTIEKINLISKSKLLQEVIVKSGSPIKIKGDTIIYTADSFKLKDGANVEDLLRKMPGFQIGKDGQLKAMGETVKNVLVDGEEFFGNDPGMVLKNLQANIVQEVQLYDKKSDQAAFTGIDDGVKEKTVNLKLKNNKKQGYFGKAELAGGTPANYTNTLMLNAFKGKRKFSAFGFMSNTGKTALGWQDADKYGGGEMDGMSTFTNDDGDTFYNYTSGNDAREGIPKNWNGGLHYSNKYKGDSLNINGSYRYSKINAPGFSQTYSKTYLPDSSWANNSTANSFSNRQKQSFNFTVERKIDSNNTIKFVNRAEVSTRENTSNYYEESLTNQNKFINSSSRKTATKNNTQNYQGTFTWNHKFKKLRRTLSITSDLNINNTNGNIFLNATNTYFKDGAAFRYDSIIQKTENKSDIKTINTSFAYTEPLTKYLSLSFNYGINKSDNSNNRNVLVKDLQGNYVTKIDSLSNDFDFNKLVQRTGINFRWVKKRITASIGSAVAFNKFIQKNNSKNTRQDYDFTNLFPTASFNLKLKGNKNIRFNYSGSAKAPSLQQLQPIVDNSDPLNIYKGNSDLKQSFANKFSGGFNWSKPLSDNSVWSYFNYETTNNDFTQFNIVDTLGRNIYQTVNVNGNKNFNASIDFNVGIGTGKRKINLGINPNIEFSKEIDFINGIKNTNNTKSVGLRLTFNKYVEDKFDFYVGPSINYNTTTSSINNQSNTKYWNFNGWGQGSFYFKKNLSINTNANASFRQKDPRFPQNNNYITWNIDAKKYVYKKEISLKIGVNDILNQNRGYDRNFSTYKSTETYYNTLKRYWLFTFGWEFTHNKKQATAPITAITPSIN